jgi:hypothetical protein
VSIEEYLRLRQSFQSFELMSTIQSQSRSHLCRSGLNLDTPLSHLRPNSRPTSSLDEEGSKTMNSPEHDVKLLSHLSRRFYSVLVGFNSCGHSYFALRGIGSDGILRNQSFVRAADDFGTYAPAVRGITTNQFVRGIPSVIVRVRAAWTKPTISPVCTRLSTPTGIVQFNIVRSAVSPRFDSTSKGGRLEYAKWQNVDSTKNLRFNNTLFRNGRNSVTVEA